MDHIRVTYGHFHAYVDLDRMRLLDVWYNSQGWIIYPNIYEDGIGLTPRDCQDLLHAAVRRYQDDENHESGPRPCGEALHVD